MVHRKLVYDDNISEKEENMIRSTMDQYGVETKEIYRARSAYKVVTTEGNLCLKRMKHGYGKASNGNYLVEHLFQNGFDNTARYIKTKNGELYVRYNKYILYVTEWIEGEECSVDSLEEAVNCIKLLAQFHCAVNNIDTSKMKIRNNLKNWPKIFYNTMLELDRFKVIIEKKKIKNEFDNMYTKYVDDFYNRGIKAFDMLNASNYYRISKLASRNKVLCHDSFYYQNILKKDDKYYLIDLDSIIIDLQVIDIAKFIRRLMFNKSYQWDFDKAKYLIEAYNSIRVLTHEELEIMIALIIFPHKFWKLGKKRYVKQKNWSEKKYMHKLEKIIKYSDLENNFIQNFINYLNTNNFKHI